MCDSGVFAPVLTFQKLFVDEGVPITSDEVRAPMGVHKRVRFTIDNKHYYMTFENLLNKFPWSNIQGIFDIPHLEMINGN